MISFKCKSVVKSIKIKTNLPVDERMSKWLQKAFNFKGQILGFKTLDQKYYDPITFYANIANFFGSQIQIVDASDQGEISFTSDNLNSSSFIHRPNTFEQQAKNEFDECENVVTILDLKQFERKLPENKEVVSVLFTSSRTFRKELLENASELLSLAQSPMKIALFLLNITHATQSTYTIYLGRKMLVKVPLTSCFLQTIKQIVFKYRKSEVFSEGNNRAPRPDEEAPSFTTYHLQERLNQEICMEYLERMHREKHLRNQQFKKLSQKVQDFPEFYRLFCEGIMDNDYESFRNQISHKVANNLEILLCSVNEMDLSRPISREEQRKLPKKKSTQPIEIIKVQKYLEILDTVQDLLDPEIIQDLKHLLLENNEEVCDCFAEYVAKNGTKENLAQKITALAKLLHDDLRPISRCLPRSAALKYRQAEAFVRPKQLVEQQPPMFGSSSVKQSVFSPVKSASNIESNYKHAEKKLSSCIEMFEAEQYGILYHYLQKRNDCLSNLIQQLEWNSQQALPKLKQFLLDRSQALLANEFTESELACIESIRDTQAVNCIYENFRYEWDPDHFIQGLKKEIAKVKPAKSLHKKSSDSQLHENKQLNNFRRKYSDDQVEDEEPSPKSEMSLYKRDSQHSNHVDHVDLTHWRSHFEGMLARCLDTVKEQQAEDLRQLFQQGNAQLFLMIRNYLKTDSVPTEQLLRLKTLRTEDQMTKILPLFVALLADLENQKQISSELRCWVITNLAGRDERMLTTFDNYLRSTSDVEFRQAIQKGYEQWQSEAKPPVYLNRIELILQEMSAQDRIGMEIFQYYPDKTKSIAELYCATGDLEDMLDSLEALYQYHERKRTISIATLNFSGINISPFEYHTGSSRIESLNSITKALMDQEKAGITDWGCGKVDKIMVADREAIGFQGFVFNQAGRLPNQQEFEVIWRSRFAASSLLSSFEKYPSQQEIKNTIQMDFLFYRAAVIHLYGLEDPREYSSVDPEAFKMFLFEMHHSPSSNLEIKAERVIEFLINKGIDVLCLQEGSQVNWADRLPKGFAFARQKDSFIIYNVKKVGHPKENAIQNYSQRLNWNGDTAVLFTDEGFLIISSHLSSKEKLFKQQAIEMLRSLKEVIDEHPMLRVMVGMDANHFLGRDFPYELTPSVPEQPTTVKKRTYIQSQLSKAGKAVSEVKDHVFTNGRLLTGEILGVDGEVSRGELLPSDRHPYDHYIVSASLI